MAKQDTELIPRLAWPAGSQVVSASGYWQLTQRDGMREEGWFLERVFRVSPHGSREGRQAPASGLQKQLG